MDLQLKTFVHKTVANVRQFFRSLITPNNNPATLLPVAVDTTQPREIEQSISSDFEFLNVINSEFYADNQADEEPALEPETIRHPTQANSDEITKPTVVVQAAVAQDRVELTNVNPNVEQTELLNTNSAAADLQMKRLVNLTADGEQFTITALLEGLLFVADAPMAASQFARVLQLDIATVEAGLEALTQSYVIGKRGLRILEHNKKFQLVTVPAFAPLIEEFLHLDASTRLSGPALETLAVIAYRQPVTRMQIEAVRGVDSASVLRSLLQRGLIEEVGRLELAGRPILYGVTDLFMQHFGITKLGELPVLEPTEADTLWATTKLAESETLVA
jgi:segregation and condensation protein B